MSQIQTELFSDRDKGVVPASVIDDGRQYWDTEIPAPRVLGSSHTASLPTGFRGVLQIPSAERVRALARHAQSDSVAYQSVAVAGLQILERVLSHEKAAASAAISLAQRDKLEAMVHALEQTVAALRMSLSVQGSKMLHACSQTCPETPRSERSWWFALTEAMEALEGGIDAISGIVASQPRGGAARMLSSVIARLMHRHHNELLGEAEQWIG